jgi:lysophospholipase L1-like esterase
VPRLAFLRSSKWRLVFLSAAVAGLGWYAFVNLWKGDGSRQSTIQRPGGLQSDALVVFGQTAGTRCTLDADSHRAVDVAVHMLADRFASVLVLSGGEASGGSCAAANLMLDVASRLGVPPEQIRTQPFYAGAESPIERLDPALRLLGAHRLVVVATALAARSFSTDLESLGYEVELATIGASKRFDLIATGLAASHIVLGGLRFGSARPQRSLVDPPGLIESGHRPPSGRSGPIVMLGTSDVSNWDLGEIGLPLVNKGHGGDRTADLLARFDRDIVAEHPSAVVLWGFENDLFDAPDRDYARVMAEFQRNYRAIVERSYANDIEPILATEVTDGHRPGRSATLRRTFDLMFGRSLYEDRLNRQILDGNDWLRELARRNSILLLDFEPVLSDWQQYRRPEFAAADGSHISPAGYEALARYAGPLLEKHFRAGVAWGGDRPVGSGDRGDGNADSRRW